MTSAKRRKLLQQQQEHKRMAQVTPAAKTDEPMQPLKFSKHFMAQHIEGEWVIFRLLDMCAPPTEDGPIGVYSLSDELEADRLMAALDEEFVTMCELQKQTAGK
jgi:hypothetical protein